MRQFSSEVQAAIDQDFIEYFFLVQLNLNSTYYLTTYNSDIVVGGNTYLANGVIFSYDSPRQNSVLDREAYQMAFVDPANELLTEFRNGVVGKSVIVRAGFVSTSGFPLTDENDLVYVYKGYVDAPSISNDFSSKIAKIEGSSPMADFDMVRPFYTTPYGMDQFDTTDTSFDRINDGYELQVRWGKV
jgi:hypothetical protein